jgi:hypothetical protein
MLLLGKKKKKFAMPNQQVLQKTSLRPGRRADLILATDLERDDIDVRTSVLHDIDKQSRLILGQPYRKVSSASVGKEIEVTFLDQYGEPPGMRWLRVGYKTPILEVADDYRLGPELRDNVVIVASPKELTVFTLRLHYRLKPPKDRDMRLYLMPERTKVILVDISQGGVRFTHARTWSFSLGQQLEMLLVSGRQEMNLNGSVVRTGEGRDAYGYATAFTALKFDYLSPDVRQQLGSLLHDLSRHKLAKRSGVLDKKT